MSQQTSLPIWAQRAFGVALMTIAVAPGIPGLTINFTYGLQSDVKTAILYGLADLGKIVIPVVCAAVGWRLYTRSVVFVCLAVSLWAVANYYADTQGRLLLAAEDQAARYNDARKDVERARAELGRISETGQAAALRQAAAEAQAMAERKAPAAAAPGNARRPRQKRFSCSSVPAMQSAATSWRPCWRRPKPLRPHHAAARSCQRVPG